MSVIHYSLGRSMDKEHLIQHLKQCQAIQFGRFVLTSGAISNYYIDIKKASTNPTVLKVIAKALVPYTKGYDVLAGMELGAVPLVVATSLQTNIPFVIVRKESRGHGTGKQIEGEEVQGKKVLIIEDVTTSGGSVLQTIHALRLQQAIVDKVVSIVDRDAGALEKIKSVNATFEFLVSIHDILQEKK